VENIKKVNNKLRGSVKPKTLTQVRAYQAKTGAKESAIVREAVELYMAKVYNESASRNRL
jgi:hypothetical protein